MSHSSHSLTDSSPNRSLAAFAMPQQPTSPFSAQQLNADSSLAPPSLMSHRFASPSGSSGFEAEEPRVYRSVTMEQPSLGAQRTFDPLASFDHGAYAHHAKDLSMNPKVAYSYAAYQPTINFDNLQQEYAKPALVPLTQQQQQPATITTITTKVEAAASDAPSASPAPPAAPVWLEPNSHFYCVCPPPSTPAHLYDTVASVLRSLHEGPESEERACRQAGQSSICTIDLEPTPARYKLACTAYQRQSGQATPFIVRIFAAEPAGEHKYVVEFQRRQGDVIQFYELFRTAKTRVQAAYPCADQTQDAAAPAPLQKAAPEGSLNLASLDSALAMPQLQLRSWSAPPLPSSSFSEDHMCETVRSLLAMCASPCVDIKYQGILALAELSCSPSFDEAISTCKFNMREALIAEGCFQIFLDCLPIECQDVHRASLTALANLVESQAHLCRQVLTDEKSLARLYALSGSATNQVVRECARFLAACATQLGPEMMKAVPHQHQPVVRQTVTRLAQHQDQHCQKHASTISKCIGIAVV